MEFGQVGNHGTPVQCRVVEGLKNAPVSACIYVMHHKAKTVEKTVTKTKHVELQSVQVSFLYIFFTVQVLLWSFGFFIPATTANDLRL